MAVNSSVDPTVSGDREPLLHRALHRGLGRLLSEHIARSYDVVPIGRSRDSLELATIAPVADDARQFLERTARCSVSFIPASQEEYLYASARVYAADDAQLECGSVLSLLGTLVRTGAVTEALAAQLGESAGNGSLSMEDLSNLASLPGEAYAEAVAVLCQRPWIDANRIDLQGPLCRALPTAMIQHLQAVPFWSLGSMLLVATWVPPDTLAWQAAEESIGYQLMPVIFPPKAVREAIAYASDAPLDSVVTALSTEDLVGSGLVTQLQLRAAGDVAHATREPLERILVRGGVVTLADLAQLEARLRRQPFQLSSAVVVDDIPTDAIPVAMQRYLNFAMTSMEQGVETLLVEQDLPPHVAELVQVLLRCDIRSVRCEPGGVTAVLDIVAHRTKYARAPIANKSAVMRLDQALDILGLPNHVNALHSEAERHVCPDDVDEELWVSVMALCYQLPRSLAHRWKAFRSPVRATVGIVVEQAGGFLLGESGCTWTVAATPEHIDRVLHVMESFKHGHIGFRPVIVSPSSLQSSVRRSRSNREPRDVPSAVVQFGTQLVKQGLLTWGAWDAALERYRDTRESLDVVLVRAGMSGRAVVNALASFTHLAVGNLEPYETSETVLDALGLPTVRQRVVQPVDLACAARVSVEQAEVLGVLPFRSHHGVTTVAVADPLAAGLHDEMARILGGPVRLEVVERAHLTSAIQRALKRRSLGDTLLEADVVNLAQLQRGLAVQRQTGVRLGQALISLDFVSDEQLAIALSEQSKLPYVDLIDMEVDRAAAVLLSPLRSRELGLLPIALPDDNHVLVAVVDPWDAVSIDEVRRVSGREIIPVVCSDQGLEVAMERLYSADYLVESASALLSRRPDDSASRVLSDHQKIFLWGLTAFVIIALFFAPLVTLVILNTLTLAFYMLFSGYKFYLIYRALSHNLEVPVTDQEVADLDDRQLPIYTILVPMYKEPEVLPTLVAAVANMDYPSTKLDVKLLLEEDDAETIHEARSMRLPAHFHIVIVPKSEPRGKPKACNYGLLHARGSYCVIFDAEDVPDPDQLKKVIVAFQKSGPELVCIQCKLNYYNRTQNLLTRWFTNEYSMWFDLFLPGLDAAGAMIPLGGTSNHFVTRRLQEIAAWDPYNVTEDADLGVRIFKAHWKTAVVDSTTYEEANSQAYNWIRQRSRWVKGYIQTYLVHIRHPIKLWRDLGPNGFFSFQMVIGGTFIGFLMNPIYWALTTLWYLSGWYMIRELFPPFIFYFSAFGLYFGNFAFTYMNVAGALRRQHYDMVKYALISPIYWAMMSVAAWKGFLQLFYAPSYWEKTVHGLYKGPVNIGH